VHDAVNVKIDVFFIKLKVKISNTIKVESHACVVLFTLSEVKFC